MNWNIVKRDGRIEKFDYKKVKDALRKCFVKGLKHLPEQAEPVIDRVSEQVVNLLKAQGKTSPTVEEVQQAVITQLWAMGHCDAAEHYTLYREEKRKQREQFAIDPKVVAAIKEDSARFPSALQYFQFIDKYARWREQDKRRETWSECCDRVIGFFRTREQLKRVDNKTWDLLRDSMYNLQSSPAMRIVQMAGPTLERCNTGAYNCSYVSVDSLASFVETLYLLMQGCGVGFSVEADYVDCLPRVKKQKGDKLPTHTIEDSTEGWCDAYQIGLQAWFSGKDVDFDYSPIRPAGSKLKTKGGRASGPDPLKRLLTFARTLILKRQGKHLSTRDCHDLICVTGKIVQVGGVRRSSEISLSDLDDPEMRDAKSGNWWDTAPWLDMANNSAVYTEKPDSITFMEEWLALARSGSGERGIFNRAGALKQIPKRRKKSRFGVNPCQPGLATVLSPDGIRSFDDIEIGSVIWSGKRWTKVVDKVCTGEKDVYKYRTNAGVFVGTDKHKVFQNGVRVEVDSAESIDVCVGPVFENTVEFDNQSVVDGWVLGDGSVHKASNNLVYLYVGGKDGEFLSELPGYVISRREGLNKYAYEVRTSIKHEELPKTFHRKIPDRYKQADKKTVVSFLRGLYSANGSVCGKRITLKSASLSLVEDVQQMLSSLGIVSYYTKNKPKVVEFANGKYKCRRSYDLNIGRNQDKQLFVDVIGFVQKYKQNRAIESIGEGARKSHKNTYDVFEIEYLGKFPVYDITVEASEHSYWTGGLLVSNCGEIILRPFQFCNLSIVVARADDTPDSLKKKVLTAATFGTFQSALTDFKYIRDIWKQNCEEERLLGVDITGQMDCPLLRPGAAGREKLLDELKELAVNVNKQWAEILGIPASVAVTCVKPSGNSAAFLGCSSGLHARWSRYQVRRVRVSKDGPIAKLLSSEGVPYATDPLNDSLLVFDFLPDPAPEGTPTRNDMTAVKQFHNWLVWKEHWTEHNPSCTVYVGPDEWLELGHEVYKHFDQIGGISFLPKDGGNYLLAPNEELSEEDYNQRRAKFPEINWAKLSRYETEDNTDQRNEPACAGGACEL